MESQTIIQYPVYPVSVDRGAKKTPPVKGDSSCIMSAIRTCLLKYNKPSQCVAGVMASSYEFEYRDNKQFKVGFDLGRVCNHD